MLRQNWILVAFLVAKATVSLTEECYAVVSNTCLQHCNNRSCDCGVTGSYHAYTKCDQACTDAKCMEIICSSGTCNQKCHNCHMECTSDVGFCRQQCLSGVCSFKCNARYCEQEYSGEDCNNMASDDSQIIIPRNYLVLLAIVLFAIIILSFLLLVLSFSKDDCFSCFRSQGTYSKLRAQSDSVESVNSL